MSKDDEMKRLLDTLRPDMLRLCDSIKDALQADPGAPEEKSRLGRAASKTFRKQRMPLDESGSMSGPPLTAKQQFELMALMVSAAQKSGLEVRFLTSAEMKAEGRWEGPSNVTPLKPVK